MIDKTLQDWLRWLESCHPSEMDLGLERIGQVALGLELSLDKSSVVTVAGTNGKGSCVAALNELLLSAGYRVGCFTSPHFLHYNERVLINGQPVDDCSLIQSFERIDQQRGNTTLTYFEFGALAAIDIFQRAELDVVILEVGLGGRLDAVNIIDADIAIVTSIDIDHVDWLGSDKEQIGREKAGIFRANKVAISAGSSPPKSIEQVAGHCGSQFFQCGQHYRYELLAEKSLLSWFGQNNLDQSVVIESIPTPNLPIESVVAAIQALHLLPLTTDKVNYQCLATLSLAGRFQHLDIDNKTVILDVAHNPAAATHLAEQLLKQPCRGRTFGLVAIMMDKDVEGIITPLVSVFDQWLVAGLTDNSRALPEDKLAYILGKQGITAIQSFQTVKQALKDVLSQMTETDRLIVFGSFFTVAEVLDLHTQPKDEKLINE